MRVREVANLVVAHGDNLVAPVPVDIACGHSPKAVVVVQPQAIEKPLHNAVGAVVAHDQPCTVPFTAADHDRLGIFVAAADIARHNHPRARGQAVAGDRHHDGAVVLIDLEGPLRGAVFFACHQQLRVAPPNKLADGHITHWVAVAATRPVDFSERIVGAIDVELPLVFVDQHQFIRPRQVEVAHRPAVPFLVKIA